MGLLALPYDVQHLIYSSLPKGDVLSLNATCRHTRARVAKLMRAISQPIFERRYGAVAGCEKEIPIYILAQRTAPILDLPVQLGIEKPVQKFLEKFRQTTHQERMRYVWDPNSTLEQKISGKGRSIVEQMTRHPSTIAFDKDSIPCLKPREPYLPDAKLWQRLTTKYQFFRRLLDETYKVRILYKAKLEAAKDLKTQPFVNIQNFIDRRRRLNHLEREIIALTLLAPSKDDDYNTFCSKLNYLEAIAFRIFYYLGSRIWMSVLSTKIDFISFFQISDLCKLQLNKFIQTSIIFNNKSIPIETSVDFSREKPGTIEFGFLKNGKKIWAGLTLKRVWKDGNDLDYTEASDPNTPIVGQLSKRRLKVNFQCFNKKILHQDPLTGDYPLLRLMTQFCVEIFQREPEMELEIHPFFSHIPLEGGFYSTIHNVTHLRDETLNARAEGKLFPANKDVYPVMGYKFILTKSSALTQPTRFVQRDTEQPSMVNFSLNGPPITWENLIQQNPLIPGSGPILPAYVTRDLSPFEVPVQT